VSALADPQTGAPAYDEVQVGDELAPLSIPVTREALVRYAGASGDFNPIHWNPRFAAEVGLPDVIAHGMFTMGSAVQVVTRWAGDPGAVTAYGVRFTKPVVVPDPGAAVVEVSAVVAAKDDESRTVRVDITARCEDVTVMGRAQATVRLR
jgi:acyl dehydratase